MDFKTKSDIIKEKDVEILALKKTIEQGTENFNAMKKKVLPIEKERNELKEKVRKQNSNDLIAKSLEIIVDGLKLKNEPDAGLARLQTLSLEQQRLGSAGQALNGDYNTSIFGLGGRYI